jgi:hypothetical protein
VRRAIQVKKALRAPRRLTLHAVRQSHLPAHRSWSAAARTRVIAVAIVVLALLVATYAFLRTVFFPERQASSNDAMHSLAASADSSTRDPVVQAVTALSVFTLEQSATRGTVFNDKYVSEGLRLLAAVVDALIVRDSLVMHLHETALPEMLAEAARLERHSDSTSPVATTRAAFMAAAALVTVVQHRNYPHLERATARLQDAARAIRLNRPLRQQSTEIEAFFQRASDAVQGMTAVQP